MEQILECRYDFAGRRWKRVSKQAKAFVEDLLVENPDERLTAEQASGCSWLNRRFAATVRGPTDEEMESTKSSLTSYVNYHKLKKLALMVVAHKSTSEEIGILRKVFERYDKSRNGTISQDEFKVALESYGYSDEEVARMFDGLVSCLWSGHHMGYDAVDSCLSNCLLLRIVGRRRNWRSEVL